MIKATIQNALIHSIGQIIEIPSKNGGAPFQKRELVIDDSFVGNDGMLRPKFCCIEFSGDRMMQLDLLQPGCRANVEFLCESREWNGKWFNTFKGMSAVVAMVQSQPQQAAYPQQGFQPQQPAPTAYPQQSAFTQQPFSNASQYPTADALPFGH